MEENKDYLGQWGAFFRALLSSSFFLDWTLGRMNGFSPTWIGAIKKHLLSRSPLTIFEGQTLVEFGCLLSNHISFAWRVPWSSSPCHMSSLIRPFKAIRCKIKASPRGYNVGAPFWSRDHIAVLIKNAIYLRQYKCLSGCTTQNSPYREAFQLCCPSYRQSSLNTASWLCLCFSYALCQSPCSIDYN